MKHLFAPAIALLLSLALPGCGSKTNDPQAAAKTTDPFVGRWVADAQHNVDYQANGQPKQGHDNTYQASYVYEMTPTTYRWATYNGAPTNDVPFTYTRAGAVLTIAGALPTDDYQALNLPDAGFTYVVRRGAVGSDYNVKTMVFHR